MVNTFVWYELMTTDREAAATFYADVVGWTTELAPGPMPYTLLKVGDRQIAGVMDMPEVAGGMPPMWIGFVGVDDVDTAAEAVKAAGAAVHKAPSDIPMVGRFAVVADPQGAVFNLFKSDGEAMEPLPFMTTGTVGWHELHTTNWEKAWDFYSGHYGWEQGAQMDMGPMGTYQMYRIGRDEDEGAMMNDPQWTKPAWLYYFAVDSVQASLDRALEHGGEKIMGPIEVPGGRWIVLLKDPQGAGFALVSDQA